MSWGNHLGASASPRICHWHPIVRDPIYTGNTNFLRFGYYFCRACLEQVVITTRSNALRGSPSVTGLIEAILTGGIPPDITQMCSAEAVYRALYRRVMLQNQRYYERFPGDVNLMHRIVAFLSSKPGGGALLPSGSLLTPRALQLLGLNGRLCMSSGNWIYPIQIEIGLCIA